MLDVAEHVVLSDEVSGDGVEGAGKERTHEEIVQRDGRPTKITYHKVKQQLNANIQHVPCCKFLNADKTRSDCVEKKLKSGEKGLAKNVIQDHQLKSGRHISVNTILAQMLMMLNMVWFECHGERNANGQIHEYRKKAICCNALECEIVCNFMNG